MEAPNEPPKEKDFFDKEFTKYLSEHEDAEDILRRTPGYMGEFEPDEPFVVKPGKFEF